MEDSIGHRHFALDLKAHRVVWGWDGGNTLKNELRIANIRRFLLVVSSGRAEQQFYAIASDTVKDLCAGSFTGVVQHVRQASVEHALGALTHYSADGLVAFGGGSVLDTAKAAGHRTGLPVIAVPTNFSGSEVTWNYGLTVDGVKETVRSPNVLPRAAIYDGNLVATLPLSTAICSGVNSIAHAVEALYAAESNPFTQAIAEAGIARMVSGLRAWAKSGANQQVGQACLSGAWLCGEALSQVGMGLHHRICHILGGAYGLPHAATHTIMLPYLIDWNLKYAPVLEHLNALFDDRPFAASLAAFAVAHGAPASLQDIGLSAGQITNVARKALESHVANPRPCTIDDIEALLRRAYRGDLCTAGKATNGSIQLQERT